MNSLNIGGLVAENAVKIAAGQLGEVTHAVLVLLTADKKLTMRYMGSDNLEEGVLLLAKTTELMAAQLSENSDKLRENLQGEAT